jgi:hypothetical protein
LNTNPAARIGPDMKIDDVVLIIFDFDSAPREFYQRVADATRLENVRRLFLNFKDSVEAEKKKLSLDVLDLRQFHVQLK